MKVLHVNDFYEPVGGSEIYLFAALEALERRGVETVVVYEHPARAPSARRRSYQVAGLVLSGRRASKDAAACLTEILREEKPDVIHLHTIGNADIVAACLAHAPTVRSAHNHNDYCPGGAKYLPALRRVCRKPLGPSCIGAGLLTHCTSRRPAVLVRSYLRTRAMARVNRRVNALLVASRYMRSLFVQNGYAEDTVKVLPYFVDPSPALEERVHEGGLLFVGRVVPQKGVDALLRCLPHVKSPVALVVAGDGPSLGETRRLAARLGLENRVRFVGWAGAKEKAALYQRASVVVVPSLWPEPFGIVGLEAMSYGKPVVAFDVGGIGEWLEDAATGFLVPPNDVRALARRIDDLLANPDTARDFGARGRKRVEEEFGEARHVDTLVAIYREALHG